MSSTEAPTALLTVTFPVRAGMDDEFRSWLASMAEGSPLATGYIGTSLSSEPGTHGGTAWRLTYRFDSEANRDAWRASVDPEAIATVTPDIFEAMPTESLSQDVGESRTSMVITEWVPQSRVEEWRLLQSELNSAAAASPGFAGIDVFEPTGQSSVWTTVITFQSPAELDAWKSSNVRQRLLTREQDFTTSDVRVQPAGSGSWFSISSAPSFRTPTWKQAMVVLAVLYPLVTAYNLTIGDWVGKGLSIGGVQVVEGMGLPFPAVIFLGNLVGTILLTWVLMPFATRVMAWWLDPFAVRRVTVRGALLVIAVYIVEIGVTVAMYEVWGI
jgi:antibiotic biosynthesis monooxygenase (ABM) superfamily enzyme